MKSRSVETIASDEEHVRLRIYEGEIPLGAAGRELIFLAGLRAVEAERRAAEAQERLRRFADYLRGADLPWWRRTLIRFASGGR